MSLRDAHRNDLLAPDAVTCPDCGDFAHPGATVCAGCGARLFPTTNKRRPRPLTIAGSAARAEEVQA